MPKSLGDEIREIIQTLLTKKRIRVDKDGKKLDIPYIEISNEQALDWADLLDEMLNAW